MSDRGAMDKLKGKAKEVAGKVTGDKRQESEGRTDQAKGKAKDAVDDLQDRARGVRDSLSRDRKEP
ncbi:CsbD family protein [Yinghuangia aomiensis]|uniref:CsbD family protein n=1 Tax=Yinghuangia aomiensis TaxID=676205 RepID=A0ABP9I1I2_9ACTN